MKCEHKGCIDIIKRYIAFKNSDSFGAELICSMDKTKSYIDTYLFFYENKFEDLMKEFYDEINYIITNQMILLDNKKNINKEVFWSERLKSYQKSYPS